ncbi:two-component system sensor histidine kinase CreC [Pseudodesulfovibrio sp. JC047]|uniref:two-component system sensor histidine kinase CreC n=1 Tax=Pseudodesulfovibrio sp. JC047 TaxID=2683199 RepID=UPI0013D7EAC6|nr:two-component system sensor histidine kinase CreC [Pseudodesulfovibrio sp. JC047]NDV18666.1 two-component system sensor histidine kinase CreC [Pseudodesulfovibrio sp. JC047]
MSLRFRLFIAFALMAGMSLFFLLDIVTDELKPAMRQTMEETLIDTSFMLAEFAREDFRKGHFEGDRLLEALDRYTRVSPDALVWGVRKQKTDHRIYVTDAHGVVLYDSDGGRDVGRDYSRWNDVYLTLRGKYGARSTPSGKNGPSVMYVAAPVLNDMNELVGVLSVGKPTASIEPYFVKTRAKIIQASAMLFFAALVVAMLFAWWHGRDMTRLVAYTDDHARGRKSRQPRFGASEMKRLGEAVEKMRVELEGKEYVEQYVHSLTHELKSPLTAIGGAVEILESSGLSDADRQRFLQHIGTENSRMREIIERLLHLASLEKQATLNNPTTVNIATLLTELLEALDVRVSGGNISLERNFPETLLVQGESFLLNQALDNLLGNALDFTSHGGTLSVSAYSESDSVVVEIFNSGESIPEYAIDKIFTRFYSLPRPSGGTKGTGLGLPFTREVAELHDGSIVLENVEGGVRAVLRLAVSL